MPAPAVVVEHLTKVYTVGWRRRPVRALDGVSLVVERGTLFGLLGPNGAGKTTLIKALLGIARPTGGDARLFDVPVGRPAARRPVGYLPEHHRFPPFLTGRQMLELYGQMSGLSRAEARRRLPEVLALVGMADRADAPMKTFSKGMAQRVGLAQALLHDPELIILDEPTDGVDPVGRREIRDVLVALQARGVTVFLNSHLLSEIERVCSRVAVLDHGRLVFDGTVDALTRPGRTYELRCTPVPEGLVPALTPLGDDGSLHRYHLTAEDRAALNAALDTLRAAAVEIDALHPVRRSLEESFLDLVTPLPPSAPSVPPTPTAP